MIEANGYLNISQLRACALERERKKERIKSVCNLFFFLLSHLNLYITQIALVCEKMFDLNKT